MIPFLQCDRFWLRGCAARSSVVAAVVWAEMGCAGDSVRPKSGAPDANPDRTDAQDTGSQETGGAGGHNAGGTDGAGGPSPGAILDARAPDARVGDGRSPTDAGDPGDGSPVDGSASTRSLWNGVDLSEWDGDPAIWHVRDGAIVGSAPAGSVTVNTFLIYREKMYADFTFIAEASLDQGGNSGIQYRSTRIEPTSFTVRGYQEDIGTGYWGMLYDERGRGTLQASTAECLAQGGFGKWITYQAIALGPHLEHRANDIPCIAFDEMAANAPSSGLIALQYHTPGGYEVRFRNLRITEH